MSQSAPPPSPRGPDPSYCDPGVDGPCLYGLNVWAWIGIIAGFVVCTCGWLWFACKQYRRGNTPRTMCNFAQAIMTAAHSYPNNSRLHGRASSSYPCLDLVEAQNCCCCLPLSLGLTLLGVLDMTRLGLGIAYAADSINVYTQTSAQPYPDGSTAVFAGMMVPTLRDHVESFLWPILIEQAIKALLWLLSILGMCCELSRPLRLLLLWLPVDLGFTIVFAVFNTRFAEDMCIVDLRMYDATGHVGARRNYLDHIPPGPLHLDSRGVPYVCNAFWRQEIAVAASDCVGCFLLSCCIAYIGWSRLRAWDRLGGPIKNGLSQYV